MLETFQILEKANEWSLCFSASLASILGHSFKTKHKGQLTLTIEEGDDDDWLYDLNFWVEVLTHSIHLTLQGDLDQIPTTTARFSSSPTEPYPDACS